MASTKTGGIRMKKMLESGKVSRAWQCVDLYNQQVIDDIFITITTRIDACNHYWLTVEDMKIVEPLNPEDDGSCRTIKQQYYKNGFSNFFREGSFSATGVIEFDEDNKEMALEHIKKPKGISNNPLNIIPHLPKGDVFFDSRHWTYGRTDEELPFAVTTRISANNQQFLKLEEKEMKTTEPQVLTTKRTDFGKQIRKAYEAGKVKMKRTEMRTFEPRTDGISNALTTVEKDNVLVEPGIPNFRIRKLTERECFRLMGVSDSDIDKIQNHICADGKPLSRSRQYAMAGNSIVVDTLAPIFTKLFVNKEPDKKKNGEAIQMSLF